MVDPDLDRQDQSRIELTLKVKQAEKTSRIHAVCDLLEPKFAFRRIDHLTVIGTIPG